MGSKGIMGKHQRHIWTGLQITQLIFNDNAQRHKWPGNKREPIFFLLLGALP